MKQMKQIYIIAIISILNLNFLSAQTVTVDDPTLGALATYTFTYTTTETIGRGTNTPNIFYLFLPTGYPVINTTVSGSNLMGAYITFKVDGATVDCNTAFGTFGGAFSSGIYSGIQLSVRDKSNGLRVNAGSTIELTVKNLITNPSTAQSYDFTWTTAQLGPVTESFSSTLDFSTLSAADIESNSKNLSIFPNPSSDFIQVSGLSEKLNYRLYNAIGSEIKSGVFSNNEKIDIKNLTIGLYFLKFNNGNILKFIKE